MFLILTQQQADAVRGETSLGYSLEPVALQDGTFALSTRVLDDPAHAAKRALLADLPRAATIQPLALPE